MMLRSKTRLRLLLSGLALAGTVSGASAQYYGGYYEEEYAPYAPRYYERYAPVPPAQIPPRAIGSIALRDHGLTQVERTVRTASSYIVDGRTAQGRRTRLIIDRYSGDLIDRIALPETRREAPRDTPQVARIAPREPERPAPRLTPKPPERPASLKPPAQASAPATQAAPPLVTAPPQAEPATPAPAAPEAPPATASAPATQPAEPSQPAAPPPSDDAKPRLVNPEDVRGVDATNDRQPPLAAASRGAPAAAAAAPITFPPFKVDDVDPTKPAVAAPVIPPESPLE